MVRNHTKRQKIARFLDNIYRGFLGDLSNLFSVVGFDRTVW